MRKPIAWLVVLALAVTLLLAIPASADEYMKYVNRDTLEAHKEPDPDSRVVKKLKGGTRVMLSGDVRFGSKYTSILLEDTRHGGQMEAWVLTKYLVDDMPPEYCKHQWGKWRVTDDPTCTHSGERERTCKVCGTIRTEKLKALGHDFGKWTVIKEATCVREGERERACKRCDYQQTETYLADHSFGKWKVTEEPTCTQKGERERKCKVCGHVQTEVLDRLPHDYEWEVTLEATDHSAGTRARICRVCGHNGGEEPFDPEGTRRRGDRGEAVRALQQLLAEQGYLNAGGADGIYGGGTEKAIVQFQMDQGLEPDGVCWPQTLKRLRHDFGSWETVKEMTRTGAGERVSTCRDCGYEQRERVQPQPWLERGRRGEDVRALQQIMKQLDYDAGGFDGIYGRKLDAAFAAFAADRELMAEEGVIRPADVDAVVNAWLDALPEGEWKGEGQGGDPVNLALTVTPNDGADDSGMVSFNWSLTNLGSGRCTFTALLLTFGETPDFRSEDLVMVLDGVELRANADGGASGSFTADMEWGEGSLHFAALAIDDATGEKWLSNAVTCENETEVSVKTVAPVSADLDVNRLPDGTWPVAFDKGDIFAGASGIYMNGVHVFTEERYAPEDVEALAVGDSIVVGGRTIEVKSVEFGEDVIINGGLDGGDGAVLRLDEASSAYRAADDGDLSAYADHGVTTLMIDENTAYTDVSDPTQNPTIVRGADIVDAIAKSGDGAAFDANNTRVTIASGRVVSISHLYLP